MKQRASKLDLHAERLEEWFLGGKTLKEAQEELAMDGCQVSLGRLSVWWEQRQAQLQEEKLLEQIATGAHQVREVEAQFEKHPAPETEVIIKLFRVLIMKLSTQANVDPKMLELVAKLTKPTLDFSRLQAKLRELELAEQKYRDQVAERKAAIQAELDRVKSVGGLQTDTLEKIERELKLI